MLKATILTAGAATAIFSALLAAPAQAAPATSQAGAGRGTCDNTEGNGLLGLALLNFNQNDCDTYIEDSFNNDYDYGGYHGHHGHHHHYWDW